MFAECLHATQGNDVSGWAGYHNESCVLDTSSSVGDACVGQLCGLYESDLPNVRKDGRQQMK